MSNKINYTIEYECTIKFVTKPTIKLERICFVVLKRQGYDINPINVSDFLATVKINDICLFDNLKSILGNEARAFLQLSIGYAIELLN